MHPTTSPTHLLTSDGHATAGNGYMLEEDYARFRWAWNEAPAIIRWLLSPDARNVGTASSDDVRVDSSSAPTINLSNTWLLGDELNAAMSEIEALVRDPLIDAPSHKQGCVLADEFGRKVARADQRYPREERAHVVSYMRCGGCEQLSLTYRPPRWPGDKLQLDCLCGYELTEAEFALAAHMLKIEETGADAVRSGEEGVW